MRNMSASTSRQLCEIISLLPEEGKKKIPFEVINLIKEKRGETTKKDIKSVEDINDEKISKETKKYLAYIFFKYLANEEEQKEFSQILSENEVRHGDYLRKKYDISNIFKKKEKIEDDTNLEENNNKLVKIETKKWWYIIFEKIKNLFRIK